MGGVWLYLDGDVLPRLPLYFGAGGTLQNWVVGVHHIVCLHLHCISALTITHAGWGGSVLLLVFNSKAAKVGGETLILMIDNVRMFCDGLPERGGGGGGVLRAQAAKFWSARQLRIAVRTIDGTWNLE
jgi:hypothetical protein